MSTTKDQGKFGEQLAQQFIEKKGYDIIAKNYRSGRAEIDLIAKKAGIVTFFEVKLRSNTAFDLPEESLQNAQKDRILEAAEIFVEDFDWDGPIQFDIIALEKNPNGSYDILHFEDAFG